MVPGARPPRAQVADSTTEACALPNKGQGINTSDTLKKAANKERALTFHI